MFENKDSTNISKKTLAFIGIFALVAAVTGATLAFFSANNVQGNSVTNTIVTTSATYGTTTVTYHASNGTISMGIVDLPESTKGVNINGLMKFTVATTATVSQRITIAWASGKVTNTFCQYANGQTCTDNPGHTFVGNEIQYALYECSSSGYTGTTISGTVVTIGSGCNLISTAGAAAPTTGSTALLHTGTNRTIAAGGTNYYALVLTLQNKTTEQNYNQGKTFSGQISISTLSN